VASGGRRSSDGSTLHPFRASEPLDEDGVRRLRAVTRSRLVLERSHPATEEPSQSFEDFYSEEYAAVVGLAYALSGSRSGG
jgi:hypothetical protein